MTERTFVELLQHRFYRLYPRGRWTLDVDWMERRIFLVSGAGSTDDLSIIVALDPGWVDRRDVATAVNEAIAVCERAIEQVWKAR